MNDLFNRDAQVRHAIASVADSLQLMDNELRSYPFDLQKTEITQTILGRLQTYYLTQNRIKDILQKRYAPAAADFLVETVVFFLRLVIATMESDLTAHSERQIRPKKNAIRPDVSIWRDDEVVAILECKTQLGWNRSNWESEFNAREHKLKEEFPNACAYLLVMTGSNWGGFGNNVHLGQKYFCLLRDTWPVHYISLDQILTPIEPLFRNLLNH